MKRTRTHIKFLPLYSLPIKVPTLAFLLLSLFYFLPFAADRDCSPAKEVSFKEPCERTTPEESAQAVELLAKSPALFVENRGQWEDDSVRFAMRRPGANLLVYDDALSIQLIKRKGEAIQSTSINARFIGANKVRPVGIERSESFFNYYRGPKEQWQSNVPSFYSVVYRNFYNGIDLRMTGRCTAIKFEFIVAPGADWRQITMHYEGIAELSLCDDRSLVVDPGTGWAPIVDQAPIIYQEINGRCLEIPGRFVLVDKMTCAFKITGDYDTERELVIDPELDWSSYLGGSDSDYGWGIAVDGSGNIMVTGWTESSGWVSGGFDTTLTGYEDAFVAKLSPSGAHLWSTYLGGQLSNEGHGIAVDGSGNIVVTGRTSTGGWVSGGFDTTYNGGERDAFVAKLSQSGAHLWSTYLGGSSFDAGYGIAVDGSGNIVVTGSTLSSGWVSGGFDTTFNGQSDGFVAKLSPSGAHLWSTYLGGSDDDRGYGIGVNGSGNIVVTGPTQSGGWVSGGFDTTYNGGYDDAFVAKLSPQGSHLWSTYLGGSDWDWGYGIAVNASGNIVVTGETTSSGWVSGGFDTTYNGDRDAFVARIRDYIGPIFYDFVSDEEGWTTGGATTVFTPPDFAWKPEFLTMTSRTNTNTFGFWQSPQDAVPADPDYLYRARFNVSTDMTAKWLIPQIRLSANSLNLQQYDVLSIESAGDGGASPTPSGTNYDLYFVPPANDIAAMLAFDLLNFNPDDAAVAEFSLDTVTVDRFALDSLSTPTMVQDYTFDLSTEGWITGGALIFFSAPQYIHAAGALELRAMTNTNTFGFWGNHPADITIEADKLYRGTFEIRTDVTNSVLVPEMRLRYNTGNLQASHTFGISSTGDGANSPGTTNTTYDRLYFLPPANCVGEDLLISFDILNFNPDDAPPASLILDHVIIETLSPPVLP